MKLLSFLLTIHILISTAIIEKDHQIDSIICSLKNRKNQCINSYEVNEDYNNSNSAFCTSTEPRIVAIGDVHGSLDGLRTDLFHANITMFKDKCEWKNQQVGTLLVQVGDIVDRGQNTLEAWLCLDHLQKTAHIFNSKVVRLIGSITIEKYKIKICMHNFYFLSINYEVFQFKINLNLYFNHE
jgi:hypothetical protein